jgi:hypothetical protein
MLDERLDESNPSRVPRLVVGLSAGAALLATLFVAIALIHRRRFGGGPP